jgi:hypothetical protein
LRHRTRLPLLQEGRQIAVEQIADFGKLNVRGRVLIKRIMTLFGNSGRVGLGRSILSKVDEKLRVAELSSEISRAEGGFTTSVKVMEIGSFCNSRGFAANTLMCLVFLAL